MKKSVIRHIKKNIPKKSVVILAFSGGPDSVYLFYQLKNIQETHPFKIILAHFNHKLRGIDSDKDEEFCIKFAKKENVTIEIGTKNISKEKGNTENAARKYRYEFLEKTRSKFEAKFIITAHHLDDNIETFLINFLRGSGLDGLSAMQVKSDHLLRPLLEITKEEILTFLKNNSIKYRIDKTNFDEAYTRNNIRKNVVPVLKKLQPSLESIFLRNWENISEAQKYLDLKSRNWITENMESPYRISLKKFNNTESFFQKLILKNLFNLYHKKSDKISSSIIKRAQKIINEKKTGKKAPFGPNTYILINPVLFEIRPKNKSKKIIKKKLTIPGKTKYTYGEISSKIIKKIPKDLSKKVYFDYTKCKFPLYVRGREDGDIFQNIGMKGTQKLQDFFVNKKISSYNRDRTPIIVDKNNKIIAIGKYVISNTCKITKNTNKIVSLEL